MNGGQAAGTEPLREEGASPVAAGGLDVAGTSPTLAYDTHGNKTRLADQSLTYDAAERHTQTDLPGGAWVKYVWGPGGDIVSRTSSSGQVSRFGSGLVLDGTGAM